MGRVLKPDAGSGRGAFHAVLLAGGSGTRFWPMSRANRPKQFLPLAGGVSLIEATWDRVRVLAPPERIWVVAPKALAGDVARALPGLLGPNLVLEPTPRDTAPAIGLACAVVVRRDPEAIVGVFPTDHVVRRVPAFARAVRVATRSAREGRLVCLGIRPDRPATGFGYLRCVQTPRAGAAVTVDRFVEKPDLARARRFLASGRYLWNGGMFVWRARRFLEELERASPATHRAVLGTAHGRTRVWTAAAKISVDYAVMEGARGVAVVPLDAGWDDVGSWDAAARLKQGAQIAEPHLLVDSPGSVVFDESGLTAVVGVPNVVVVRTGDALLVVARDRAERVKGVVDVLRERGRGDVL